MKILSVRIRMIDGVAIAAGALLVLKAVSYLAEPATPETGPDGLPKFARVLAHARTNYTPPDPDTTGSVPAQGEKSGAKSEAKAEPAAGGTEASAAPPPAEAPKGSPAERAIRERLGERREELQQRARGLDARQKALEEAERRADAKAEEARLAEERATGGPDARESAALKGLVVMYETMKPKDAARVFDRLPEDVLVPVVRLIAPRKMAEIMAAMNSDSAQRLTIALARPSSAAVATPSAAMGLPPGELPAIEPPRPAPRGRN